MNGGLFCSGGLPLCSDKQWRHCGGVIEGEHLFPGDLFAATNILITPRRKQKRVRSLTGWLLCSYQGEGYCFFVVLRGKALVLLLCCYQGKSTASVFFLLFCTGGKQFFFFINALYDEIRGTPTDQHLVDCSVAFRVGGTCGLRVLAFYRLVPSFRLLPSSSHSLPPTLSRSLLPLLLFLIPRPSSCPLISIFKSAPTVL